jgi:hypothetical protein
MILQTIVKHHRKFEIIHEVEALTDFATENASPEGVFVETIIQHNKFNYAIRIDAITFLTETEYQFRLGDYNRQLNCVTAIYVDCETLEDFLDELFAIL